MWALVTLVLSCMLGVLIPEIYINHIGLFEAFTKAINSLPINMLTSAMSTEITKWVIQKSHFYMLGGILMLKNVRNAFMEDMNTITAYKPNGGTNDLSAWV